MSQVPDIHAHLSKNAFFSALSPEHLRHVTAHSRLVELAPRATVWREGCEVDSVALVVSGRCKLRRDGTKSETILDVLVAGDIAGDLALTLDKKYKSDLVTLRRSRLLLVPASCVREVLERDARATTALALNMGQHVLRLYRRIEDLGAGSVESRVARLLVRLSERAGEPFPGGTLVPVRLRRRELASMAATTLESISRTLNKWDRDGIIRLQPIGFVVCDEKELVSRCG